MHIYIYIFIFCRYIYIYIYIFEPTETHKRRKKARRGARAPAHCAAAAAVDAEDAPAAALPAEQPAEPPSEPHEGRPAEPAEGSALSTLRMTSGSWWTGLLLQLRLQVREWCAPITAALRASQSTTIARTSHCKLLTWEWFADVSPWRPSIASSRTVLRTGSASLRAEAFELDQHDIF